ncbi:MAG: hypothetical protein A3A98_04235 [Candidatus Staskawiczbacteria bacterium RIFCSPLOWO2_01_FULL_40_39]|uniref:Glycosyl transferase family 1 n=1 Tax=Candidatus Staskawiczbacteria bacterium RIFCSPHIGHO2_01_FULL_39_25 TaxID=1802202 RepID=A0A1G2HPI7_9BACT|nr:MAG: hypothetical protein A2730_03450 [Candidatus Staskawiczbacteria bacterium RIFCSPHIGHO2_01_FULL_39_25]OGZ73977.1 MAG: hypothetical protein A3A98_04235 [Candidatus Staskawiczbacteria bacterium RIFCSPLOWO2_01_FULL_40_39]
MSKNIKICYVVAVDITIKLILLNYIRRIKQEGYEVSLVCSPSPYLEELKKEGFNIQAIKISRRIQPFSDLLALLKLYYFFKKEKFDIVQVQTPKAAFLGQLAAGLAKVPIIINNNFGFYFENFSFLKKKAFIFFERLAAQHSDLMFTINKEDITTAVQEKIFPPEKIEYLGFGINLNRFNPDRFPNDFVENKKRELGISPNKKVIGIIARLVKEKGYLELFKAFKIIIEKFPNTVLLIVGIHEPQKKDSIDINIMKEYGIEDNVIFLGERKDIEEIYTVMDIFVLPSHREGLGNTLLEASAMKKPLVAYDIRGCRESVDNQKTGILVPLKNSHALADAMIYLIENPAKCLEFGKQGRKRIEEKFNEDIVFKKVRQEYEELISHQL